MSTISLNKKNQSEVISSVAQSIREHRGNAVYVEFQGRTFGIRVESIDDNKTLTVRYDDFTMFAHCTGCKTRLPAIDQSVAELIGFILNVDELEECKAMCEESNAKSNNNSNNNMKEEQKEEQAMSGAYKQEGLNGGINLYLGCVEDVTREDVEKMTEDELEEFEQDCDNFVIDEISGALGALEDNDTQCAIKFITDPENGGIDPVVLEYGLKEDFGWICEEFSKEMLSYTIEWEDKLLIVRLVLGKNEDTPGLSREEFEKNLEVADVWDDLGITRELAVSDDTAVIDRIASELHDMYADADYYGQMIVLNDWMYEEEFGCVHLTDIFSDEGNIEYFTKMSGVECHRIWASGVGEVTFDVDWSDVIPGDEIIDQVNDLIFKWYETHQVKGFDDDFNDAVENAAEELGFSVEDTWNCVDYDEMVKALSNTLAVAVAE